MNAAPGLLASAWTIARKDLAIELRTGEMASSMFLLALLIIIVFAFTLEPERLVYQIRTNGVKA